MRPEMPGANRDPNGKTTQGLGLPRRCTRTAHQIIPARAATGGTKNTAHTLTTQAKNAELLTPPPSILGSVALTYASTAEQLAPKAIAIARGVSRRITATPNLRFTTLPVGAAGSVAASYGFGSIPLIVAGGEGQRKEKARVGLRRGGDGSPVAGKPAFRRAVAWAFEPTPRGPVAAAGRIKNLLAMQ